MSNGSGQEHGIKWWIRYVIVPLVGGGGLIAIVVAFIPILFPQPNSTPQDDSVPTPTPVVERVFTPPEPAPEGITSNILDEALGAGNWFCLEGYPNGITIRNVPASFTIAYPFFEVDKLERKYTMGENVPAGGPATGWLQDNLLDSKCSATIDRSPLTTEKIDAVLGVRNWYCITGYPTGFKIINVPDNFVVQKPLIAVDKYDVKYGPGEIVPGGGPATAWFAAELPLNECP